MKEMVTATTINIKLVITDDISEFVTLKLPIVNIGSAAIEICIFNYSNQLDTKNPPD